MPSPDENNLDEATSPYLQDHADNPVNWYTWGEEAINQAQKNDKPIFLSVGYSACHWCHVMKRESFQDPETAEFMNQWFVNIKVDREERPDVDEIYMQAVQNMTGRGGWPMSVFLTPDLKPFYGGTYFPPEPRQGMPDFQTVLKRVHETYESKRDEVEETASQLTDRLKSMEKIQGGAGAPTADLLGKAYDRLDDQYDEKWGGFGDQPKFPRVMDLQFLLRLMGEDAYSDSSREMILGTLDGMMLGGLFDQIGGGFARYSTDRRWLVPHFEKMLYDNAQLLDVYGFAAARFDDEEFERVVDLTLSYLDREMSHPDGAFFSTQDAESEGEEGKYYTWDYDEFCEVLGDDAELFSDYWGVTPEGNFEGKNILHRSSRLDEFCEQKEIPDDTFRERLEENRSKLLDVREDRVKPHRDEKILTDWNGLMASAQVRVGFLSNSSKPLDRARNCLDFLHEELVIDGELFHTYRDGFVHTPAFLDDYAFLIKALLEMFQVTGNWEHLQQAKDWYELVLDRFWDSENNGFFQTEERHENLIIRSKNPQDKAQPSGNSEMVHNALKLSGITGVSRYREHARETLAAFSRHLRKAPTGMTRMLAGLYDYHNQSVKIVVVGRSEERTKFLDPVREYPLPGTVILQADPSEETEEDSPLLQGRLESSEPKAYLCQGGSCRRPAEAPNQLRDQLQELSGRSE